MKEYLDRMKKILHVLASLHGILIRLCEQKRDALVQVDMQALNDVIAEEEKVTSKVHQVEQERLRLTGQMHNLFFADQKIISLENMIQYIPEPEKSQLAGLRSRLLKKVKELQAVNEVNKSLCEQSLSTVTYYLNVFTSAVSGKNPRYDMHARQTKSDHTNLLDRTA